MVQIARNPEYDYEFVFNPTGLELPEVYDWIDSVEKYFNKKIHRVGKDLRQIISEKYNYFLPQAKQRYCTRESKIFPYIEWINGDECIAYYGIRADENREGFNNSIAPNITPKYPLQEMGIDLRAVYIIINNAGLKPPVFFWESIYQEVKIRLGFDPKLFLPEWLFDMLFAWRSRANCDRCFNQRRYEWIGLLEHHPDRFWEAESWEHLGGEGKDFTWINDLPLKQLALNADIYKQKRIEYIVKFIRMAQQKKIFKDDEDFIDILEVKSCGLFCGK